MFCRRNGKPIPGTEDYEYWQRFLAAGMPRARVHDARHTAATVALAMGVDPRAVMEILGWSSITMLHRRLHAPSIVIATAVASLIRSEKGPAPGRVQGLISNG
ncbi:integrase [Arthrobacter woluwensis]|uniref:tyrosine-type recombinase/integrase n=1 Tax=Arthrobacter woluwensis TaxID=156980 RepID=UPI0027848DB7|nr:integrase [Arthrobacter woluwensis]